VRERQAFAWNPTVTGTKVEDTVLVDRDSLEVLTGTPGWPAIALDAGGRELRASDVLVIG
jgi:hypothetical protein